MSVLSCDETGIGLAVKEGDLNCVKEQINGGEDVNQTDDLTKSLLHIASQEGHTEIAKFLTDKGANIYALADKGFTPLMYAAESGHIEIVELLIKKVKDDKKSVKEYIDIRDDDGQSAIDLTIQGRMGSNKYLHIPVMERLLANKADIRMVTEDGKTYSEFAIELMDSAGDKNLTSRRDTLPAKGMEAARLAIKLGARIQKTDPFYEDLDKDEKGFYDRVMKLQTEYDSAKEIESARGIHGTGAISGFLGGKKTSKKSHKKTSKKSKKSKGKKPSKKRTTRKNKNTKK
jgi:ankyrin repeat protein